MRSTRRVGIPWLYYPVIIVFLALILAFSFRIKHVLVDNFPTNVSVDNLPTNISVNNFPTNVSVTNFPPQNIFVTLENGTRVLLQGVDGNGNLRDVSVSAFGSVKVSLHDPRSAFGTVIMDSLWPVFQVNALYGVNLFTVTPTTFGSGSVTNPDNRFLISTGSTNSSFATLQSRGRVSSRSGQGSRFMFGAKYDNTTVGTSIQFAGCGTPENGVFFGYASGLFGVFYAHSGLREVRDLQITTGSTLADTANVTLDGVLFMVPLNSGSSIQKTVYDVAKYVYAGWRTDIVGDTVRFISDNALPYGGAFTFTAVSAVGSFSLARAGVVRTTEFVPQIMWNGDRLDGSGASGFSLLPQYYHVYQIALQTLGAGPLRFYVQVNTQSPADTEFILVHQMFLPNSQAVPTFGNPSFPFSAAVTNFAAITTTLEVASMAGFVEGAKKFSGNRFSIMNSLASSVTTTPTVFFTIRNARIVNGRTNQGVITLLGISSALKHTQPATILIYRTSENHLHDISGSPDFQFYGPVSGLLVDKAALTFTPGANSQLVWSGELAEAGSIIQPFDADMDAVTLQPGESLSVCGITKSGTASYGAASLDIREDS